MLYFFEDIRQSRHLSCESALKYCFASWSVKKPDVLLGLSDDTERRKKVFTFSYLRQLGCENYIWYYCIHLILATLKLNASYSESFHCFCQEEVCLLFSLFSFNITLVLFASGQNELIQPHYYSAILFTIQFNIGTGQVEIMYVKLQKFCFSGFSVRGCSERRRDRNFSN